MQTRQGPNRRWMLLAVAVVLGVGQQVPGGEIRPWATLKGHTNGIQFRRGVNSLAFSPDGRTLASGSEDNTVKLWEVASGKLRVFLKHSAKVNGVAFAPGGKLLTAGGRGVVRLWDAAGRARGTLWGHDLNVRCLCFSSDGTMLAAGGLSGDLQKGYLRFWDILAGKERFVHWVRGGEVTSASFLAGGRILVVGQYGSVVTLRETTSGKVRASLKGHRGFVSSVAFIPGSDLLASAGEDGTIRLWDVRGGKQRHSLSGHDGHVLCLAVSGRLLASGGTDATVRVWDTATRKQVVVIAFNAPVWSVAFSPDGKLLATGGASGTIRLWSVAKLLGQKEKK